MAVARQTDNGMTGEFFSFAGFSFLVFKNYAHMDGADFDLCSDNGFAGTEKRIGLFLPLPVPYKCRTAGEKKSGSESFF